MTQKIDIQAVVPEEYDDQRFDQIAAQLFPDFSRSRLQGWIKAGCLTADGKICKSREKLFAGTQLLLQAELEAEVSMAPEDIPLDIVYEDDDIIVLNKPAGLVVHPAAGHPNGTLVNALLNHLPDMVQLPRAGIVHRLDMDTSGIMVVAKTLLAHGSLVAQLQERTVTREYEAVCMGVMTGGGKVDKPMGRHSKDRKKMAVLEFGGKTAITHYRVAERFANHTHVYVNLETGRTHQIRVHMAHIKYPLVGDSVYAGRPKIPKHAEMPLVDGLRAFPRQALHARKLKLIHPRTGKEMQWSVPTPQDLVDLLDLLRNYDR